MWPFETSVWLLTIGFIMLVIYLVLWGSPESIGRLNVLSLLLPSCEWELSFLSLSPRIMYWYSLSATMDLNLIHFQLQGEG